jgi:hypothetical protein
MRLYNHFITMFAGTLLLTCGVNESGQDASASPIGISVNQSVSNHADASSPGSLAAVLKKHVGVATYTLLTDQSEGTYVIDDTVILPAGATLQASAGKKARIKASAQFLSKSTPPVLVVGAMLELKGNNKIIDIVIDANRNAQTGVYGKGVSNIELQAVQVINTRNDYPNDTNLTQGVRRPYLVSFEDSKNIAIVRGEFRNAGANPKLNPDKWAGIGTGLRVRGITQLQVLDSIIEYTLGAGIDFTGSTFVSIKGNQIRYTGQNANYSDSMSKADGLAGYHTLLGDSDQNISLENNRIIESGNHGIHVSGRGIQITNNLVEVTRGHGIYIGDWRDTDGGKDNCSANIRVMNNVLLRIGSGGNFYPLFVQDWYIKDEITFAGNQPTDVQWGRNSGCANKK